jgi:hypothetical protein
MTEQHQLKISASDEYYRRVEDARTAGLVTSVSGLGKTALGHAMQHGQPATESLLRTNGLPSGPGQDTAPQDSALQQVEQLVTAGVSDVITR